MSCGCNNRAAYGAATTMPELYSVPVLVKGLVHPLVSDFRKRLAAAYPEGKLANTTSPEFDWDLEFTLNAYQYVKGIPQTGVTDIATWSALLGVSPDRIKVFTPEPVKSPPSGTSPLLWVAAAAAAWWALS